jgi:hypothetical protein
VRELNLDQSGEKEVLLAFGKPMFDLYSERDKIWLGRVKNDSFVAIAELPSSKSYYYNVDVVRMQGSDKRYIVGEFMGGNYSGFSLFKVVNGKIFGVAVDRANGHAELVDENKDGYIDSYSSHNEGYQSCYYSLSSVYKWNKNRFVFEDTYFDQREMLYGVDTRKTSSMSPKDVVSQYLKLAELDAWFESSDIKKSLKAMYSGGLKTPQPAFDIGLCSNNLWADIKSTLSSQSKNKAVVKVGATGREVKYVEALFYLEKQNNRWRIMKIE